MRDRLAEWRLAGNALAVDVDPLVIPRCVGEFHDRLEGHLVPARPAQLFTHQRLESCHAVDDRLCHGALLPWLLEYATVESGRGMSLAEPANLLAGLARHASHDSIWWPFARLILLGSNEAENESRALPGALESRADGRRGQ